MLRHSDAVGSRVGRQAISPHGDQRDQAGQCRGGAQDRRVRPLRCASTPRWARTSWNVVSTRQRRTNQPRMVAGCTIEIGAEKRGWLIPAGWVTDQNPADRRRRDSGMVPKCNPGGDGQPALLGIVPLSDDHARPGRLVVLQHSTRLAQSPPVQRRAAPLTWPAFGCRPEQAGVQPQPGDHTDTAADGGQQPERRDAVVVAESRGRPRRKSLRTFSRQADNRRSGVQKCGKAR